MVLPVPLHALPSPSCPTTMLFIPTLTSCMPCALDLALLLQHGTPMPPGHIPTARFLPSQLCPYLLPSVPSALLTCLHPVTACVPPSPLWPVHMALQPCPCLCLCVWSPCLYELPPSVLFVFPDSSTLFVTPCLCLNLPAAIVLLPNCHILDYYLYYPPAWLYHYYCDILVLVS